MFGEKGSLFLLSSSTMMKDVVRASVRLLDAGPWLLCSTALPLGPSSSSTSSSTSTLVCIFPTLSSLCQFGSSRLDLCVPYTVLLLLVVVRTTINRSAIRSFLHSFTHVPTSACPIVVVVVVRKAFHVAFIHSFIHSFIHPSIHLFIHSLLCLFVCVACLPVQSFFVRLKESYTTTPYHHSHLTRYDTDNCVVLDGINETDVVLSFHKPCWTWNKEDLC